MLNPLIATAALFSLGGLCCKFSCQWQARGFAQSLREDERILICRYVRTSDHMLYSVDHLVKACSRSVEKEELLRSSTQPEDNTLLRAAQYTDEKAQDQLLRPAQSHLTPDPSPDQSQAP